MISREDATRIVRAHVAPGLSVTAIKPLAGGMINVVQEWMTDGTPRSVVAKLAPEPDHDGFRREFETLAWYRAHTEFPVPQPYACVSGSGAFTGTCLLMERIAGRNLGEARLSARGAEHYQRSLAAHLIRLHRHTRNVYGCALGGATFSRYLEIFKPALEYEFAAVRDQLPSGSQQTVQRLIEHLDEWLPEAGTPTLIHGDIWATNIIVDDADPDRPEICAFIDMGANYRDVEQELAYLLIFHTAGDVFFKEYAQAHVLRPGFERRCRVYWLNTWLLHVRLFGASYLGPTQRTIREIERLW
jgi:fructosamine-3-kinase